MHTSILFVMLISLALMAVPTRGTVIHVPGDQTSIQGGINAAVDGDTVLVAPGTYSENISFRGRNIVLASHFILNGDPDFIETTIIDGSNHTDPDTGSTVLIISGEDSTAVLEGFTVTGGTGTIWWDTHDLQWHREGGGILIELSSPTIRNNHVVDNEAVNLSGVIAAGGGGIRCMDGNPLIENNLVMHNRGTHAAGVEMLFSTGTIRRNVIVENSGGQLWGGGGFLKYFGGTTLLENNTIAGNSCTGGGDPPAGRGGAMVVWGGVIIARNNIIWGNTQEVGDQIHYAVNRSSDISYNDIEGGWEGVGNINEDPLFADDGYTLSENSPCIDAGDPNSPLDLDGTRADIGAFTYYHLDTPYIRIVHCILDDSQGNTNGNADGGETVDLVVTLINTSLDATGVSAALSTIDPDVELIQDTATFGDLPRDECSLNDSNPFSFSVDQYAVPHRSMFYLNIAADGGYEASYSFELTVGTATILLVDDDEGTSYERCYFDALETKNIAPGEWNVAAKGCPTVPALLQYGTVVWLTGNDRESSLTSEEQGAIAALLDGGGNLFMAGSNIGYDLVEDGSSGDAAFYANYLHAEYISDSIEETFLSGVEGDPISGQFSLLSLDVNQTSPSVIAPLEGASTVLTYYSSQEAAAIKFDGEHKVVYSAVGFEGIRSMGGNDDVVRGTLLKNALQWFSYVPSRGDVNQDGGTDILDVLAAVNIILGAIQPSGPQDWAADCTGDGAVDIIDALGIVNVVLGIGECVPSTSRPVITAATIRFCESLENHLSPEMFAQFMALVNAETSLPTGHNLAQNYPNPFNPETTIRFTIPQVSHTSLTIYNITGELVKKLADGELQAGYHSVTWDGKDTYCLKVSSGVYFYTMKTEKFTRTRKMLIVK
ncbi:MAG: T9SS type A sorting domain-containing protein [Gemmatimonadota bacterium]|nr:MAG: T9SS type A sorting domain-containing protein [Gemmatimonadota bacterium]